MISLKLNNNWDLELDAIGNIATVENKAEISQTVATAVRLFKGDFIFNEDLGIPYIPEILGQQKNNIELEPYIREEALRINGVANVELEDVEFKDREFTGNIKITTTDE